jgi:hypothetical protein
MQANVGPGTGKRNLGAIAPRRVGGDDFRIADILSAQTPQRVTDDRPLGFELRVDRKVLQLAPPAMVAGVVRTARLGPIGPGTIDGPDRPAREALMPGRDLDIEDVARRGPRHEDGHAVRQSPHTVSTSGDPVDRGQRPRRAARRAAVVQGVSLVSIVVTGSGVLRRARAVRTATRAARSTSS